MWQLNLAMSEEEAIQIVDLYDTSGKGEMRYEQLVKDVCAGVRRGVLGIRKKDHHAPSLGETTPGRRLATRDDGRVTRNRRRSGPAQNAARGEVRVSIGADSASVPQHGPKLNFGTRASS